METVYVGLGIVVAYLLGGLRVLREYERGVYFFLGRLWGAKGPGLIFLPPLFARMQKVSLRVVALDIPPQDVITRDNISIKVNAVLYMKVRDAVRAVNEVENYLTARTASRDRKSTRLNSSHSQISYAVFCLKKKKKKSK